MNQMEKMAAQHKTFVYVGNWTFAPSSWDCKPTTGKGFGIFGYDRETGALELIKTAALDRISVGATCLDARRRILYCVDEVMSQPAFRKGGGGLVYALAIDPETGELTELNRQPSYGSLPTYVTTDADGKYLLLVNHTGHTPVTKVVKDASGQHRINVEYDDSTTVLFRLNTDGSIGDLCDVCVHSGSGPLPLQTHAKLHSVVRSPSGELFAVCDKGSDKIFFFKINRKTEKLELCGDRGYAALPGSSPRYSVFHPTRPYFFMNNETKGVVCAFRYDEEGRLDPICTINAFPEGREDDPAIMQSDFVIHPSGKYLYTLIRLINVVTTFRIDEETGQLEKIQTATLDGAGPRGCAISPDGRFMLIAALESKQVLVWRIGEDGRVSPTGQSAAQPVPGNVTFFPA